MNQSSIDLSASPAQELEAFLDQPKTSAEADRDPYLYEPTHPVQKQKWLLCSQRIAEIRKLCHADGVKHLLFASPYIALYLGAIVAQFYVDNVWANVALSVLIGNQIYLLFILHHDCMHGSAFKNDAYNRLAGRLYAMAFTMTFTTNRETHKRHHLYIADPERDPDEYYFAAELSQIWLRIWRYYEWYTRISLTRYGSKVRRTVFAEQVFNLLLWAAIHVVLIKLGLGMKVIYIFWLPLAVVSFIINPITRGYEHAPLTLHADPSEKRDMTKNTITVDNRWLGYLWANITFHVEHHAYPRCPFYNLQKLHKIFQEEKLKYLVAPYPLYRVHHGQRMTEGMTCNAEV
jgi:fatty acid desaturase